MKRTSQEGGRDVWPGRPMPSSQPKPRPRPSQQQLSSHPQERTAPTRMSPAADCRPASKRITCSRPRPINSPARCGDVRPGDWLHAGTKKGLVLAVGSTPVPQARNRNKKKVSKGKARQLPAHHPCLSFVSTHHPGMGRKHDAPCGRRIGSCKRAQYPSWNPQHLVGNAGVFDAARRAG